MRNYSTANGYMSDHEVFEMLDMKDASMADNLAVGTGVPCLVGGAITAASAYLGDACPTGGCTHSC